MQNLSRHGFVMEEEKEGIGFETPTLLQIDVGCPAGVHAHEMKV
jgi:hypothetical protein